MVSEKKGNWVGYWCDDLSAGLTSITDLLALTRQSGDIIKDDHRSQVKIIVSNDHTIVVKQPRDKNRRLWARLLTLIRDSEVKRSLRDLSVLQHKGIETLRPIGAIEKRCWGMVTDSWLVYFYLYGRPCREEDLDLVLATLQAVHRAGFRHEDPHIRNFLYDGRDVFVIDCRGKPRLGRVSDCHELLMLKRELERGKAGESDVIERARVDTASVPFRLALAYHRYRLTRHRIKSRFRKAGMSRDRAKFRAGPSQK